MRFIRVADFAGRRDGTHPLPCFLEVLILRDFKSFVPEVLILRDFKSLFPEVLIPEDFKSMSANEIEETAKFPELLILHGLRGAKRMNGWI
jgi:hypothetical protein